MAAHIDCPLLGGDTVATPGPLTLSITALGAVPPAGWSREPAPGRRRALCLREPSATRRWVWPAPERRSLASKSRLWAQDARPLAMRGLDRPLPRRRVRAKRWFPPCAPAPAPRWTFPTVSLAIWRHDARLKPARHELRSTSPACRFPTPPARFRADPACLSGSLCGGDDYEILCAVPSRRRPGSRRLRRRLARRCANRRTNGRARGGRFSRFERPAARLRHDRFSHF